MSERYLNVIRKILSKCSMQRQAFPKVTNLTAVRIAPLSCLDGFRALVPLTAEARCLTSRGIETLLNIYSHVKVI
jgi:hypothetical protein